ncbi:hypothetical protein [Streptomyces pseudogriseolus]|uniref:hypothetical protein n=1 Tax=Streptomyces pseudogriseolus TaxID=36817 RepID=UPI000A3CB817
MLADMLAELNACRLHGRTCSVPWGYDRSHTDSTRPYTVHELADRFEGPHRYAYPTADAYEEGFALWRALRRDGESTYLEGMVSLAVRLAPHVRTIPHLRQVHADPACTVARDLTGLHGAPPGFAQAVAALCRCDYYARLRAAR